MDFPNILHLRTDRALLNTTFEGYKLSLEPVPILKSEFSTPLYRIFTSEDQYSFLHAKLFSLHNHLFRDPWTSNSGYFLDGSWTLKNVRYKSENGSLDNPKPVFRFPKSSKPNDGYNVSCKFVSDKLCVFSDGCGLLQILNTGDRSRIDEWKSNFREYIFENSTPFILQDTQLEVKEDVTNIYCLLLSVQEKKICEENEKKFESVIDWIVISKANNSNAWSKKHVRQLRCHSLPEYCALETDSNGLLLSADEKYSFEFDIENPIVEEKLSEDGLIESNDPEEVKKAEENGSVFTWSQTDEDICIYFSIGKESVVKDFKVFCTGLKLNVLHKKRSLLDSELYEHIDNDLTTWNLENEALQVTLMKREINLKWPSLLRNIEIAPTDQPAQRIRDLSQSFSSRLRTDMEECDYVENTENEYYFVRVDVNSKKVTHKVNLGSNNPILFTVPMPENQPSAFALRSDVDIFVWLPMFTSNFNEQSIERHLQIRHEGTLNAIGYIQASKQQKKFIQCSPDFSYSIICEPNRHLFIYKNSYDTANGLKNRTTNARANIGQQKLITLDESDEVLGILCENDVAILLTQNRILCLQIKA